MLLTPDSNSIPMSWLIICNAAADWSAVGALVPVPLLPPPAGASVPLLLPPPPLGAAVEPLGVLPVDPELPSDPAAVLALLLSLPADGAVVAAAVAPPVGFEELAAGTLVAGRLAVGAGVAAVDV